MSINKELKEELINIRDRITRSNKKQILKEIHELLNEKISNDKTLSTIYSEVKKLMGEKTKDKRFLNKIKADQEVYKRITTEYKKTLLEREQKEITESLLNKIKELKNGDLYDRAIYLLTVSGSRLKELLEGEYSSKRGKGNMVHIKGLVQKKKTAKYEGDIVPLIEKKEFLSLVRKFQKDYKKDGIERRSFNRTLNRRVKKLQNNLNPHGLRGIYALLSFTFNNPNKLSRTAHITKSLNHSLDISSLSYTAYILEEGIKKIDF